jgi:anti-anti-sigma factor
VSFPAYSPRAAPLGTSDGTDPVPPSFTFHVSPSASRLVIEGEIDIACYAQLSWRLAEAVQMSSDSLELDVAAVTFIDCSGLRAIDRARRELEADGKRLVVIAASDCFRRVSRLALYVDLSTEPTPSPRSAA